MHTSIHLCMHRRWEIGIAHSIPTRFIETKRISSFIHHSACILNEDVYTILPPHANQQPNKKRRRKKQKEQQAYWKRSEWETIPTRSLLKNTNKAKPKTKYCHLQFVHFTIGKYILAWRKSVSHLKVSTNQSDLVSKKKNGV